MSVEERELAALRVALERSSPATQKLLGPLLPLVGVRDLLLSFVRDASRSFEDWVWDPQVRAVLERFRLEDAAAEGRDVDRWYERAASERLEALQSPQEDASAELRRRVESAQQDGRDKFRRGNFYAARNAFARSLDALLELQRDEYYGKAVDPAEWEPEPQRKFVTLCCNVAVCAIKEQDAPVIREFARKALAVDPNATKALYAMAKVHLLEHLHEDAMRILDEARAKDPNNRQWDVLQREIEAAVAKDEREKAELAEIKRKKDEELAAQQLSPEEAEEREKAYKERVQLAAQQVPLPTQEDDALASVRIHTYFMKIKQQLLVEVKQLHESERGESPLFSCSVANGTTGELLATDVRGSSKKSVKNEACKLAIKKLWERKQAAGTLVEADLEYLAKLRREASSSNTDSSDALSEQASSNLGEVPEGVSYPVRLSITQRQLDSVQLLNQLDQQGKLRIRFEFEDVSPHPDSPMFQCTAILNGESVAVAQATKKKKARAMAGDEAKKKAFEKNLLMVWDPPELRKGGARDDNEAHP